MRSHFSLALACLALSATLLPAQDVRGVILGQVIDPAGAAVAGAVVKATNVDTSVVVSATTNETGSYLIPYLLPGSYRVSVEMRGFKTPVRGPVELRTSEKRTVDFQLELLAYPHFAGHCSRWLIFAPESS